MKVKKTAKTTIKKKHKKGSKKSEEPMVKVLNLNVNPENPRNGFLNWIGTTSLLICCNSQVIKDNPMRRLLIDGSRLFVGL